MVLSNELGPHHSSTLAGTAGVSPANASQARNLAQVAASPFSRLALIAGGTPAVPAERLSGVVPVHCLEPLATFLRILFPRPTDQIRSLHLDTSIFS